MASPESYATETGDPSCLWKDRRPLLAHLDMELTERCSVDCIHCYINLPAGDRTARKRELPTARIREILEEARSLGCLTVRFTGGEPLIRKDFEELYVSARRLGLRVILFTNATLITPHLAGVLARMPPLEAIEITVYGMRRESYEAVTRTPGSFEAARRGMKLLLERHVPFVVKGALLRADRREIEEFEAWAATLPWMDRPPSQSLFLELRARRDEKKNEQIRRLRRSPEEGVALLSRDRAQYVQGMQSFCAQFLVPPGDGLFACGSGVGSGCVDAYGAFQPCMTLRHPDVLHDLNRGTLEDALRRFFPQMRRRRAANPAYLARCARCFLKGLCEQCPARSWAEHGTLDTPVDYACLNARAQARELGLLADGERPWDVKDGPERLRRFVADRPGRGASPRACGHRGPAGSTPGSRGGGCRGGRAPCVG